MKKIVLSSIVAASLAVSSYAENKSFYLGVGVSNGSGTQERSYSSGNIYETEYDASAMNYKLGILLSTGNRFEISSDTISVTRTAGNTFAVNDNSSDTTSEFTGWNMDYLWMFNKDNNLKPFIDLGFGFYENAEIHGTNSSGSIEAASGVAFNLGLGLVYEFTEFFELEASYKGKGIAWNLSDPEVSESISLVNVGINLKF